MYTFLISIATTMAQDNSSWPSSSAITSFGSGGSQPQHHKSASKTRVVIPVERVEVVQISDKDSRYSPKVGLNRLPVSFPDSTQTGPSERADTVN
ncbi:hypothetical protein QFC19_008446 [Naganishia cerealis]|uniref:Uncharacterized protein n=1 Tax=Naganishia cerealis TaxID=610337 RepID=A0ACC2V2T2_9TREE|nr:hypothetical protein QFC19_008446 [Naganishia cerealis]